MSRLNQTDLEEIASAAYSAVFSDVLDQMGHRNQAFESGLQRLSGHGVLVGYARPVRSAAVDAPPARHYGVEIDFVDGLAPGDVVVGVVDGSSSAFWGELFSTAAMGRGARGLILDGNVRDLAKVRELGFPVHCRSTRPTDCLGRIAVIPDGDQPVSCCGVEVANGDLVVADADGVVSVPAPLISEAVERAMAKATTESAARELLLAGGRLADVWERFRVL